MTEYTDQIDEAYSKAISGEPRHFAIYVSSDLDVEVLPPDDANKAGLVKIVENDDEGEVTVFPGEVRALINALTEAVLTLAEWQSTAEP